MFKSILGELCAFAKIRVGDDLFRFLLEWVLAAAESFKFLAFENHRPPTTIISTFILYNIDFKNCKYTFYNFHLFSYYFLYLYLMVWWYKKNKYKKNKRKSITSNSTSKYFLVDVGLRKSFKINTCFFIAYFLIKSTSLP